MFRDITADALGGYKVSRLIATYVDESGKRRVAGSPDWPLSLDYSIGDGVFSVTLQGEDTAPDRFPYGLKSFRARAICSYFAAK